MKNTVVIVAVQSTVNGKWNYCPEVAADMVRICTLTDGQYRSSSAALAAARTDQTIPMGATFKVLS